MSIYLFKASIYHWAIALIMSVGFITAVQAVEPRALPEYTARLLGSEREVSFADYSGQVILINTWATWCSPCRAEMPDFEKIHQRYHDQGLKVVGINIDEGQVDETVARFVDGIGISFPIWRDPHNRFSKRFRSVGVVPETYLVDRNGMIIKHWQGPVDPNAAKNLEIIKLALGSATLESNKPTSKFPQATPRRGKRLADQRGCLTCHSIDGSPKSGPTWKGMSGATVTLIGGIRTVRDHAYLRRAIVEPDSEIVAGYVDKIMAGAMPGKPLTPAEVEALIVYFDSLSN